MGNLDRYMANGDGEFRGINGSFYKGKWKDDRPHGKGIETNKNGEIYDGEFVDGKKHGYGEMNFMDGSIYKGDFRFGEMHGQVRLSSNSRGLTPGQTETPTRAAG